MWNNILGHSRQIEELKKTLAEDKLPNAYLFSGLAGVGKRMTANALAMAIACPRSPSNNWNPCGACAFCGKVASDSHPDIFVVEPEAQQKGVERSDSKGSKAKSENIKIEQVRELQARLQYHALEAPKKLAIIDEADRMTESTANSLLKILEEPPQKTHFVLISRLPHRILPTIRSRSRHMPFGPLPDRVISETLARQRNLSPAEAQKIARLAGGSLGLALSINPEFVEEALGRFKAILQRASSADVIETAEEWAGQETVQIRLIFDLLASWYRDILRFHAGSGDALLIHSDALPVAQKTHARRAERAIAEIASARKTLETSVNKQLMFENLLFTLTN